MAFKAGFVVMAPDGDLRGTELGSRPLSLNLLQWWLS